MIATVKSHVELPQDAAALWTWTEHPYVLVSLLDMLKLSVAGLMHLGRCVSDAKFNLSAESLSGLPGYVGAKEQLIEALSQMLVAMQRLELSMSIQEQVKRQIERLKKSDGNGDTVLLLQLTTEIQDNLHHELEAWTFFAVRPELRAYYDAPEKWCRDLLQAYPESERDLRAAGRCLSMNEWTACVFHLMRTVETALRKWADQWGLVLKMPTSEANWQDIISAADRNLKALEQEPKSAQRTADLEYFGGMTAHFLAIKNAWRNHVAHGKQTYDGREAGETLQHVLAFMRKLATRS